MFRNKNFNHQISSDILFHLSWSFHALFRTYTWHYLEQKLPKSRHIRPPFSSFYLEKCLNDSFRYMLSQGTEENSNAICSLVLHFYVNTFVGDRLQSPNDYCRCLNYYNMIVCEPDLRCVNQALVDSLSQFLIVPDA